MRDVLKTIKETPSQVRMYTRALCIAKSLGVWVAARYLAKRGVSIETALYLLTIKEY